MNNKKGFTLIELMVTLVVAAILLTVAVPSFSDFINRNKLTAEINGLLGSLHHARSEAAKRNRRVTVCPCAIKSDGSCISNSCGTDWNNGYIVFINESRDCTFDSGDELVVVGGPLASSNKLTAIDCPSFMSSGRAVSNSENGYIDITKPFYVLCNTRLIKDNARHLFLSNTGYLKTAIATQNSCP